MDVKELLIERGIRPMRSRGQYFLIDESVATRMVEYAGVESGDVVLEIGAGVGSLTEHLERKAKKVYAVEKDAALCEVLRERFLDKSRTEVLEGDIMKLELPKFDKVVASIPFSLSSSITYKLLLHSQGFGLAVLLYQKEFAQKLSAMPGSEAYGRLSVLTQVLADVENLEIVHHDAFYPSPPVKTAVVRLKEKEKSERIVEDKAKFFELVTVAFAQRRKKMKRIVKTRLLEGIVLAEMEKRPEDLSWKEFVKLAKYTI